MNREIEKKTRAMFWGEVFNRMFAFVLACAVGLIVSSQLDGSTSAFLFSLACAGLTGFVADLFVAATTSSRAWILRDSIRDFLRVSGKPGPHAILDNTIEDDLRYLYALQTPEANTVAKAYIQLGIDHAMNRVANASSRILAHKGNPKESDLERLLAASEELLFWASLAQNGHINPPTADSWGEHIASLGVSTHKPDEIQAEIERRAAHFRDRFQDFMG